MGLITIELIDDYRSEFGNAYNSYIDEDVYYDAYGFPFFPAWIMKNSLMSIAEKLLSDEEIKGIFGDSEREGSLVLEHAIIGSRESMRYAVITAEDNRIKNPQLVLNQYTHTEKFYCDGKECNYRILNRGLIFEQSFRIDEKYRDAFERLVSECDAFDYGRGRIACDIDWNTREYLVYGHKFEFLPAFSDITSGIKEGRHSLKYSVRLMSPVCVCDPMDAAHDTKSFIPGELVRKALDLDDDIMNRVRVSFAFCEINGKRSQPVSSSFSVLKTDKKQLRDRLSDGRKPNDYEQLNRLSGVYIDDATADCVTACSVETEYGKVYLKDSEKEELNSYCAICEDQIFQGFIEGEPSDLGIIIDRIRKDPFLHIGEFTDIGYGLCSMHIEGIMDEEETCEEDSEEVRVLVMSPVAIRQDNGLYTDSAEEFLNAMKQLFGYDDLEIVNNCKEAELIQGYSKEWIQHRPLMFLTKGGSVFRLRRKCGEHIHIKNRTAFIGEHTEYGFGELTIYPMNNLYYRKVEKIRFDMYTEPQYKPYDQKPGRLLIRALQKDCVVSTALALGRNDAVQFYHSLYQNAKDIIVETLGYETADTVILKAYLQGIAEVSEYLKNDNKEK